MDPQHIAINISLYCDGTQLNSFGTKKACGVYLWINNLPRDTRLNRAKKGGAILVGYIPEARCCWLLMIWSSLHFIRLQGNHWMTRLLWQITVHMYIKRHISRSWDPRSVLLVTGMDSHSTMVLCHRALQHSIYWSQFWTMRKCECQSC